MPFFQRAYVWTKPNWEDMLADLLEFGRPHFLGSLILKQQKPKSGEQKEVLVIDGQQRLTTLSLLLKALYDSFSDEMRTNCRNELLKYLFYKRYATDKSYQIKIVSSRIDGTQFRRIIGEAGRDSISAISKSEIEEISEKSNKVLQCYKYFMERLEHEPEERRVQLFNQLLSNENKIIVLIDLSEHDNEQSIFDTINSAGVRLSGTDICQECAFSKGYRASGRSAGH